MEPNRDELLAELRESEARQRALLTVLPDLMFRLHRDGTYLQFAGDLTRLATPASELLGSNLHDILPPDVAERLAASTREALAYGELTTVEYQLTTLAGELRDFEVRLVPAGPDEVVTIVRDITDRKRGERELRESRARIVQAGDAERQRLERNLHDGAQQRLVTVSLHLHLIAREPDATPKTLESLALAQAELASALDEIRQLVRGLHPPLLSSHGLGAALRSLVARAPAPIKLEALPAERLPEAVEAAAYYVIAEALANASKHAGASQIVVRAVVTDGQLELEVADDAAGGADLALGSGLRGLADRVAAAAGSLEIESPPGDGTRMRATIPL